MDILLEDIARTLNATCISLPGNPNQSISYGLPQPSAIDTQHGIYRPDPRVSDHQLPVNIGLDIERSIGAVRSSPDLGEVSSYQRMPLMTQPRSLERQLA